jgi:LytR cell envelope-related transcriptional attenuator
MSRVVTARAAAIVILAVALGVILLQVGTRPPAGFSDGKLPPVILPTTTVPTTAPGGGHATSTTTTSAPLDRADVKVLVANGSSVNGAAGTYTSLLSHQGWGTLTAVTADAKVTTSTVYYAANQQVAAADIAATLALLPAAVQPLTAAVPVPGAAAAAVVVLIGTDLATKAPGTTTTTKAG